MWSARITQSLHTELRNHLFPGDGRPHGAALLAGIAEVGQARRLLVREVIRAVDGIDYVPGTADRGHHRLTAAFVRDAALRAASQRLAYLAVHVHGGGGAVSFSGDDLRSHERGYPALLDVVGGPVGALVLAEHAAAGDIWSPGGDRASLSTFTVVGPRIDVIRPQPPRSRAIDPAYDRQARLFGDAGQELLRGLRVGVIGVGGVGMLLVEYLARLGVGRLVLIDPDRVEPSNLPRLPGSRRSDARALFQGPRVPGWLRERGRRLAARKVDVAARLAREANRDIGIDAVYADVREPAVAARLLDCDYLFLAANSDQARLLFNALVHQYLIPGAQVGAKVQVDPIDGRVVSVHSIARTVLPGHGCLWCNEVISPARLADEAATVHQRRVQRYVDDAGVVAPSVITLNATAAAIAANDFLFSVTGLTGAEAQAAYCRVQPVDRDVVFDEPRSDPDCGECSQRNGRLALGDDGPRLPTFYRP